MKTRRIFFTKSIRKSFLVLSMVFVLSCTVDVPPVDSDPPVFTFNIQGDGFDHTFSDKTNFNNITLMLRLGVTYQFTFFGADGGGMDHMSWVAVHTGNMEVDPNLHGDWNFSDVGGASALEWHGNQNDPVSGSIIGGTFTTQGDVVSDGTFRFTVRDYGGESGRRNTITEDLRVVFGAHNTRIRED